MGRCLSGEGTLSGEAARPRLQGQFPGMLLRERAGLPVRSVDFTRGTDNITVRQGDTAILRCYVEDRSSKVAWLNRSGIIFAGEDKWSLDPRVELEKRNPLEYSLRIQKVDVYDEGSYTCSVQTQHHPKTSQVYLIVQVPPKISNISSDITVNEGSNVTLVCMANGRPEPVITWRHLTPTGREFEGEEEYLEILGITREQSGKYECKAANEVASADVKQVRVTVNYPPTITESKSNEAATGRQALLRCEASAVPTPDFEWYRDDTRINSANGLEIKSTGSQSLLMVANVTEEHYGNYTCVAANKLGVTNASLYLYKRVLPTLPNPFPGCRTPAFTVSRVGLSTAWSPELLRVENTWKNSRPALLGLPSLLPFHHRQVLLACPMPPPGLTSI
ncbi:limbic system-associated membrane protein isoform X1 [Falco naumanni]|uniref:limbic system-associated membrane protein isoform X1 n=1 Tax=Falco naumanni TaxID=148594 RepID=UPI001ADEB08F|nr:limbic system-associated membrane protein isoform X1 [Falco naumanni]